MWLQSIKFKMQKGFFFVHFTKLARIYAMINLVCSVKMALVLFFCVKIDLDFVSVIDAKNNLANIQPSSPYTWPILNANILHLTFHSGNKI